MRKIARTTGLIALGLAGAVLCVELAVRVTVASPLWRGLPVPEVALYGPDPFTGYRHRANVRGVWIEENRSWVMTSSLGLRDRERPLARSAAPRVVVLGNSVLEALQVELPQTAVYIAEQRLQVSHKGAEVINLGLAGANPPVEVARLQSLGVSLKPDVAVVFLPIGELSSPQMTNDNDFAGYRQDSDGQFALHYAFRETRSYRFRTSRSGHLTYWLLDHSAVMRIYNNRKNVGLFAEWPRRVLQEQAKDRPPACFEPVIAQELALWRDHMPARTDLLLQAVIRDLSAVQRQHRIKVIVAVTGVGVGCSDQTVIRKAMIDAVETRLDAAGLRVVDFDGLVTARVGADNMSRLRGFRERVGSGHLNVSGNRVWGETLADILNATLAGR